MWGASVGGVESRTVTVNEPVFVLPAASVAVQVTVVSPSGNVEPDGCAPQASAGAGSRLSFALNETMAPAADVASATTLPGRPGFVVSIVHAKVLGPLSPSAETAVDLEDVRAL